MKKITMRMVAAAAGVSQTTVSRVVNNDPRVDDFTRGRVLAAIREQGYPLRNRNGRRGIGVIMALRENSMSGYFAELLTALSREISRRNGWMELVWRSELDALNERVIAGAIDISTEMDMPDLWEERLNLPLVRINAASRRRAGIGAVITDSGSCFHAAVLRLAREGHRKIFFISFEGLDAELRKASRRWPGFLDGLREIGVDAPEQYGIFLETNCPQSEITAALSRAVADGATAFICPTDLFGIRVDPSLHELGLRIPEDISLICSEYLGVSAFQEPPRTTIAPDFPRLAAEALDMLDTILHTGIVPPDVLSPARLIERASVGPASAYVTAHEFSQKLTPSCRKILRILQSGPHSATEIAGLLGLNPANGNFRQCLARLRAEGIIAFTIPDSPRDVRQRLQLRRQENGTAR